MLLHISSLVASTVLYHILRVDTFFEQLSSFNSDAAGNPKRVVKLSREQEDVLKEQTEVEQHLTDDEIKQYIKDVMEEIQRAPRK